MRKTAVAALITVFLVGVVGWSIFYFQSKPVSSDRNKRVFVINQGDSFSSVAERLERNRLIRNRWIFMMLAYKQSVVNKIQAGSFKLSPDSTIDQVLKTITTGGNYDYWLRIIEGQRVEEIKVDPPEAAAFGKEDFVNYFREKEGYLFPDSYLVPINQSLAEMETTIKTNFEKKFTEAKEGVGGNELNDQQILILASLIEREARLRVSKQMVAGILLNRLREGMALQVDATVQYARDSKNKVADFWQPVKRNDLAIVSPYNTYRNPGLPPGPICNPGADSIYAAFHPVETEYFFYITGNDHQMHYAKTLDEHNQNIARYLSTSNDETGD